jgi:hypothetical protein
LAFRTGTLARLWGGGGFVGHEWRCYA